MDGNFLRTGERWEGRKEYHHISHSPQVSTNLPSDFSASFGRKFSSCALFLQLALILVFWPIKIYIFLIHNIGWTKVTLPSRLSDICRIGLPICGRFPIVSGKQLVPVVHFWIKGTYKTKAQFIFWQKNFYLFLK